MNGVYATYSAYRVGGAAPRAAAELTARDYGRNRPEDARELTERLLALEARDGAPCGAQQCITTEESNNMPATATDQRKARRDGAMSMSQFYKQRRREGLTHSEAIERACAQFSYPGQQHEVEGWLAEARREYEHPAQPPEPEPEPVAEAEPDPLDALEAETLSRMRELTDARSRLALDAIADEKARAELAAVESDLAECERQLERVGLARAESGRRRVEAAEDAERSAREKAGKQAVAIERQVAAAAAAFDDAAAAVGVAAAKHAELFERARAARLRSWGQESDGSHRQPPLTRHLRYGLRLAGCAHLVDFGQVPGPDGPLSEEV
jgi:hypothetical protein